MTLGGTDCINKIQNTIYNLRTNLIKNLSLTICESAVSMG